MSGPLSSGHLPETLCLRLQDQKARARPASRWKQTRNRCIESCVTHVGNFEPACDSEDSRSPRASEYVSIAVLVDTDISRMSTTGLVARVGEHMLESDGFLQGITALSVGKPQCYAAFKGSTVALMLKKPAYRRGYRHGVPGRSDSSTTKISENTACFADQNILIA